MLFCSLQNRGSLLTRRQVRLRPSSVPDRDLLQSSCGFDAEQEHVWVLLWACLRVCVVRGSWTAGSTWNGALDFGERGLPILRMSGLRQVAPV